MSVREAFKAATFGFRQRPTAVGKVQYALKTAHVIFKVCHSTHVASAIASTLLRTLPVVACGNDPLCA
jgi:hypothetical protein